MSTVVTRFKVARVRSPAHLERLRSLRCCVRHCRRQPIHAHHVRIGAGVGMKPDDTQCVNVCWWHHEQGHRIGWRTFEALHGLDLTAIASWHAFLSWKLGLFTPVEKSG